MSKITRFADIPKMTRTPGYRVNMPWDMIESWLDRQVADGFKMELNPDFQRGHVWTEAQQIAYVEFRLRGGESGREIMWTHPGWMRDWKGVLQVVDGLQRLTAARRFIADEIPAFGSLRSEYTDTLPLFDVDFIFYINDLQTRAEVLTWYLEFNSAGTPHTQEELDRVRALLIAEQDKAA